MVPGRRVNLDRTGSRERASFDLEKLDPSSVGDRRSDGVIPLKDLDASNYRLRGIS